MASTFPHRHSLLGKLAIAMIAGAATCQLFMVFLFEANWDEFFLLDWFYLFQEGQLPRVFSTLYFHALGWVPHVGENEVDQIIAIRVVMYLCASISCLMIFMTARRFFSVETSMLVLLTFLSFSSVFRHATSFRVDTISLPLLMTAIYLVTGNQKTAKTYLTVGLLIGLAGMVTIKSIFYAIMIGVILLIQCWFSKERLKTLVYSALVGITSITVFSVTFLVQSQFVPIDPSDESFLSSVIAASLYEKGFFPEWEAFIMLAKRNLLYFMLLITAIGLLFIRIFGLTGQPRERELMLLAMLIPLSTLFFYRHAHPYFYIHMLATASVLTGLVFETLKRRNLNAALYGLTLVIGFVIVQVFASSMEQTNTYQRKFVELVHTLFPEKVDYIDRTAMISSYKKHGLFMSRWKMQEYYKAGQPIMAEIIEKHEPKFLIANIDGLDLDRLEERIPERPLLDADTAALRMNYIHHWGPLYVPGKTVQSLSTETFQQFEIKIAGTYTIESEGNVDINRRSHSNADIVQLEKGTHHIDLKNNEIMILRWGNNLYKPETKAPDQQLFRGF